MRAEGLLGLEWGREGTPEGTPGTVPGLSQVQGASGAEPCSVSAVVGLQCVVDAETGEPRDDLSPEALEFCQRLGSKATKVSEIISSKDKAVYTAIQKGISAVNERAVSNAQKVQKWVLLEKDFSLFGGELGECLGCALCPFPGTEHQHNQNPQSTELPLAFPPCGCSTWQFGVG